MTTRLRELETSLSAAQTPRHKIDGLNALAEYLGELDSGRALALADEAIRLAEKHDYHHGLVAGLLNQGWAYYTMSDYTASVRQTLEALKLARQHEQQQHELDALNILGNNHNVVGNRADAMECFTQALKIGERIGDKKQIAAVLNNIGMVYNEQGDHRQALQHFERAMNNYTELAASGILPGISLLNMADTYNRLQDYDAAIRCAQDSLETFRGVDYAIGEAHALSHTGTAFQKRREYQQAITYFQQALAKIQTTDAKLYEGGINRQMAEALIEQGSMEAALTHLEAALAIFESLDAKPDIFATHELFARVYKTRGNFEQAFHHLEQFHSVKEQVFNEKADSRQKTLQAIYEVEKARLEAETQYHRNMALQNIIEQNEQMIAELDSYADNVAHDLRNPIGIIVAYAALLDMNLEGQLDDDSQLYLKQISEAAQKLDDIVGALLSLAKARKDEILPQEVDMAQVVQEAQQRLQPMLDKHMAVIQIESDLPPAMGHASWLEEVWVNYIGNAIKYGGALPLVTVGAAHEQDGFVRYWVQDNGKGVPAEDQSQLFRKFERLGQYKIEGHGLGLTIVKTIVDKLGGQVSVSSSGVPGAGSTFSFTLPQATHP